MGGTFDPVHFGHLVAAEEALVQFNLDRVVFMPTGRPVRKTHSHVSSAEDRYLMTVIATASNPDFEVSRLEIDRPGSTYTVDTMVQLREMYGPEAELFFISGADAVRGDPHVEGRRPLRAAVHVHRGDAAGVRRRARAVRARGPEGRVDGGPGARDLVERHPRLASRRADRCATCCLRPWPPTSRRTGSTVSRSSDLLGRARELLASRLSQKSNEHCERVAATAVTLARRFGVDERDAELAGLLHDYARDESQVVADRDSRVARRSR